MKEEEISEPRAIPKHCQEGAGHRDQPLDMLQLLPDVPAVPSCLEVRRTSKLLSDRTYNPVTL